MDTIEQLYKVEIEESVLSSFLYNNDTFFEQDFETDFFTHKRQLIFSSISKLINNNVDANIATLSTELGQDSDAVYLCKLTEVPVSHNLEYHYDILRKATTARILYHTYGKAIEILKNGGDPDEIISESNLTIVNSEKSNQTSFSELSQQSADLFQDKLDGKIEPTLKTGFSQVDRVTGGFRSELILITGRPGMGKTAFALNIARNWGYMNVPGLIFSIEMSAIDLVDRMVCDVGSIDNKYVFRSEWEELVKSKKKKDKSIVRYNEVCSQIHDMPIDVDPSQSITIDQICNRARRDKIKRNIKWIIVDYVGLINGWNKEGQESKAEISRRLKMLSKELSIPVVALCQMNRKVEERKNKEPLLSDLRDSGSLEQDADMILSPYSEGKGVKTEDDQFIDAKLFMMKNRKGQPGLINGFKWQGHYFRFSEKSVSNYER